METSAKKPGTLWLVIAHEATNSGAPRVLLEVLRGVRVAQGEGWSCEIFLDRPGPLEREFAKLGRVSRSHLGWSRSGLIGRVSAWIDKVWFKPRRFRRWIVEGKARGATLIYSNTGTNGRLLDALPPDCGRVISHIHELGTVLERFSRPADLAATLARTDVFLAVSEAVGEDLRRLKVDASRIKRIPNFLAQMPPPRTPGSAQAQVCRELGIAAGTRLIVGCGHLAPIKGTEIFVTVAQQVSAAVGGGLMFLWIGGDTDRDFAEEVRRAAGAAVRFVGEVDDPSLYFAASEMLLVTSRLESFSRVALEAGALGRPVLAFTEARGPRDLLPEELLVNETSAAAMAAAVISLLTRPADAQRLGEALRARIAKEFLAEKWIGELLAVADA